MTNLLIRDLSPELASGLREHGKATGKSLSEVAKSLIRKGLVEPRLEHGLGTEIRNLLGVEDYADIDIARDSRDRQVPSFE